MPPLLLLVAAVFLDSIAHAGQNPADSLTEQRRNEQNWLRLQSDRKAYESAQPDGSAEQARMRSMRLQQQSLRDKQDLLRQNQAARVARQKDRIQRNLPGHPTDHTRGTRRLKADRRFNQMRLQNRMQRYRWPRN